MKLRISKQHGGALIVVLLSSLVMGVTLASYLQYTSTQSRSIMRSQSWNAAIPVAEAGIGWLLGGTGCSCRDQSHCGYSRDFQGQIMFMHVFGLLGMGLL